MRKAQSIIEIIVSDEDITQYEPISRYALTPDMIREPVALHGMVYSDEEVVAMALTIGQSSGVVHNGCFAYIRRKLFGYYGLEMGLLINSVPKI